MKNPSVELTISKVLFAMHCGLFSIPVGASRLKVQLTHLNAAS
jgi:hypothetical protein